MRFGHALRWEALAATRENSMTEHGGQIDADKIASASKRSIYRLIAAVFLLVACFSAICAKVLLDARQAAWERAAEAATSMVAALESDIARNIESYDLSIQGVMENLQHPGLDQISPDLRQLVLFDRSATAHHLDALVVLDKDGIVRYDSRSTEPEPADRSGRDYFKMHKNSGLTGLFISRPIVARSNGVPIVALSRRLPNHDGSFAGVVVGSLKLSYFEELFKNAALGANGNITLFHDDGTVIMRWPAKGNFVGSNFKNAEIFRYAATAQDGRFESRSAADGTRRLFVFSRIGELPLLLSVGQPTDDIYADWRRYALVMGLMIGALAVLAGTLTWYLVREMRRRAAAERKLAVLATTDGLTGLANRRHLNAAIHREWRRALREQNALALMMIDTDHFKSYNDLHGHQAGDKLLQTIAASMFRSIRRPSDTAARYGGDEFVILLPGTTADGAVTVAEELRACLAALCVENSVPASNISIGIASRTPSAGETFGDLLAAADSALYRAKENGRNCTEVAPEQPIKRARRSSQAA